MSGDRTMFGGRIVVPLWAQALSIPMWVVLGRRRRNEFLTNHAWVEQSDGYRVRLREFWHG